ncbi:hypothetical protein JCM9140_4873 [Halalkalibacter wakoensis JCM 9140]|uniref:HTH cro/C1-type domain-containing protein n=2 Tax=Halalkalibacter TaxID=2893056 RepID=W4QM64_9BACI|nr:MULTISPECIES: helix-turn-helix transcriptional regulator [Halalkalibacter]GAE28621.1 hypothetical protein JCM9140_4873 [Halalkalibacter wakoensis JCM 9140]GAE32743.1 hypothetical protein JCM9152_4305 [Halalkalibacter hemicellulosilyticusJCM 9152]
MEHIGERIKKTRHAAKLKQKEFAQTIRMSQGSLSDLEIGRNKPSIETLVGISELYNVTIDWLIKGTGNKKKCLPNDSKIPLQIIISRLLQSLYTEQEKLSKEFNIPMTYLQKLFNHEMNNRFLGTLTVNETELLNIYRDLPVKDQNELREFAKIKKNYF